MLTTYTVLCIVWEFFRCLTSTNFRGSGSLPNNIITYPNDPIILGFCRDETYKLLFMPSESRPPIEEQLYLFMKRFRTQPSEFFNMDRTLRLSIYFREWELVKSEYEKAKKLEDNE